MNTPESYNRFHETYREVSRNFAGVAEEEQISYYTALQDLHAKAEDQLRPFYENYFREIQAASAGDDSAQRAAVSFRNFQREYGRIQAEYVRELGLRQQRMFETMNALSVSSSVKVVDSLIEYLSDLRQNLAQKNEPKPSEPKPSEAKPGESKSAKK